MQALYGNFKKSPLFFCYISSKNLLTNALNGCILSVPLCVRSFCCGKRIFFDFRFRFHNKASSEFQREVTIYLEVPIK